MKLICLNIWGGTLYNQLIDFIQQHADSTDFFCFQEVFGSDKNITTENKTRLNILQEIEQVLPNFQSFFALATTDFSFEGQTQDIPFGLATFVKKDLNVNYSKDIFIYKNREDSTEFIGSFGEMPKNLQYTSLSINEKELTIANLHGFIDQQPIGDSPERLEQAKKIKEFLDNVSGAKLICGDFNMNPENESLKIIESGMRNLTTENGIKSTRADKEKVIDYIIVSQDISVTKFEVLNINVSDHLPLITEFSL